MSLESDESLDSYRWVVLLINWLIVFFMYGTWLFILVIFDEIPFLTDAEEYLIWTLPFIGLICMALPAGLLIDKYGLKKTGMVGISVIIIASFCRGLSPDFLTLAVSSIFLGFGIGIVFPTGSKLISFWFGEREIGTASGIFAMAGGLGVAVAQSIAVALLLPWLGSWQAIFFFYGVWDIVILFLWIFFIREKPPSFTKKSRAPLRESISKVIRNKYIWIITFLNFIIISIYYSAMKALHPLFEAQLGELAHLAIAMISYGAVLSNVSIPFLSDRLKNRKAFLIAALALLIPSLILVNYCGIIGMWIFSFSIGFMVGIVIPIILTIPIELSGVGHLYVAGAVGLITMIGRIGGLITPLIFLAIQTVSSEIFGFLFLVILLGISVISALLLPETAGKAQEVSDEFA